MNFKNIVITLTLILSSLGLFSQKILEAPDFSLTDTEGNTYNLYEELDSNKVVFLYFFDINCYNCVTHIPELNSLWQYYGSNGNEVWLWGIEFYETYNSQTIAEWGNTNNVEFPLFSIGHATNVPQLYDINYTPQLFIICPDKTRAFINNNEYENFAFYVNSCLNTNIDEHTSDSFLQYKYNGVNIKNPTDSEINIDLFDITGRIIISDKLNPQKSKFINIQNQSSIYVLSIRNEKEILLQRKIAIGL
jgi:peroxiredoxin